MIRLVDLLSTQGIALGRYKIHLATPGKTSPLEAYWQGTFKEWQEQQNGRNFECETVVGLIHRGEDRWLFAGVYRILGVTKGVKTPFQWTISQPRGRSMIQIEQMQLNVPIDDSKFAKPPAPPAPEKQ